ncbi:protein FAM117B-like [Ruditapes philippinarum]|uniref:protein FAM117B-like n=1 Tax=Ruditapes philippinarum TaxID=129788 RepID=UPI00295BB828|nr:protein FAM117B-like [Ruditapes philippinarum]
MRRNVSPPQRQGPMKAVKPFILKSSPSRSPSSPCSLTLQRRSPVTDSRHSPDRRSPGPSSPGFKGIQSESMVSEFWHSAMMTPEDWHVEVIENKAEKKKKKHRRSASFGHADKKLALNSIRQKLQKTKDQGTKQRSSPIPGNHNALLQTAPAVLMRSPAIGIHIPKTSIPRYQRNSVEGLNPSQARHSIESGQLCNQSPCASYVNGIGTG